MSYRLRLILQLISSYNKTSNYEQPSLGWHARKTRDALLALHHVIVREIGWVKMLKDDTDRNDSLSLGAAGKVGRYGGHPSPLKFNI